MTSAKNPLPRRRGLRAAIGCLLAAGLAFVAFCGPSAPRPLVLPCGLHAMTGLPCPFCGGTRAARAALGGDWSRALYLNALAFPALLLVACAAATLLLEAGTSRRIVPWDAVLRKISLWGPMLVVLAIIWWIPHLVLALRTPKPELVNLHNPVAAALHRLAAPGDGGPE